MANESEAKERSSGYKKGAHPTGSVRGENGRVLIEVLYCIGKGMPTAELLREVVTLLADWTGFEAVGLRLREGDDYPYFKTKGMSEEFIRLENSLCPQAHGGHVELPKEGGVPLECVCGAVIQGKIDRSQPFVTEYGSLWTNSNTRLLNEHPELKQIIRGNCVRVGYESSALIPLRLGDDTFGLLQFEDKRPGMFSRELLATFESIAVSLALALSNEVLRREIEEKERAKAEIKDSEARFRALFDHSPEGVLLADVETMQILLGNEAASQMLGYRPEDLPGLGLAAIHPETDMPRVMAEFDRLTREDKHFVPAVQVLRKDGAVFLADISAGHFEMGGRRCAIGLFRDITERRLAEKSLHLSEEKYGRLFEDSVLGIFRSTLDGKLIEVNPAFAKMFGFDCPEEATSLVNDIAVDIYVDPSRRKEVLRELLEANGPVHTEILLKRKDGSAFAGNLHVWIAHGEGANGKQLHCEGFVEDISERKQSEEALKNSELRLRTILQTANEGFWVIDNDATVIDVNPRMCAILDRSREEVLGHKIFDFVDDQNKAIFELQIGLGWQGKPSTYEIALSRPDGSHVFCQLNATPLTDGMGKRIGAFSMVTDISERKRAEKEIMHSNSLLRNTFHAIQDLVSVHDKNLRVVLSNWYQRDHVSQEERRSFPHCYACYMRRDTPCEPCPTLEVFRTGRAVRMEKYNPFTQRMTEVSAYPVVDASGDFELVTEHVRDITDIKRAEQEREKLQAQLMQAQKMESVGRLAGGVAHDFNNMLGVIIGRAEMALFRDISTGVRDHLEEILKAGRRSADLTRQLLAFARKQTAVPKVLDLNDTISSMFKLLRRLIKEEIDLSWTPGVDLWAIKIDPSQIDQILANLLVNAGDAIAGVGAVAIRTENVVINDSNAALNPGFTPGDYVLLSVSDTGKGIGKEVCEKIFEPFFTTKEVGKGTGLGLSTVYGIVKQNDGFIYVESRPGEGATFKIYLPRFEAQDIQAPSKEPAAKSLGGTETILLVEDDESVLNLSRMILERLGYKILAAHTPLYGLQLVEEYRGDIDLVITDVVMPGMNGRELIEKLRVVIPGLKCLFMSGYTSDVIAHRGIMDQGVNFIQKPFSTDVLAAMVRQILNN